MIDYRVFVKQIVHLLVLVDWSRLFGIVGQVRIVQQDIFGDMRVEGIRERHADERCGLRWGYTGEHVIYKAENSRWMASSPPAISSGNPHLYPGSRQKDESLSRFYIREAIASATPADATDRPPHRRADQSPANPNMAVPPGRDFLAVLPLSLILSCV